jgi:flagellar hook assembly protein FlgD
VDATVERITRNVLNRLSLGVTSAAPGSRAPATFTLASANPTRSESIVSYELQAPAYATLSVYDVQGRLVRHGPAAPVSEGQHFWVWDLRDDRGARVPPGVYYQRLRSGDFTATLEAVVLR